MKMDSWKLIVIVDVSSADEVYHFKWTFETSDSHAWVGWQQSDEIPHMDF